MLLSLSLAASAEPKDRLPVTPRAIDSKALATSAKPNIVAIKPAETALGTVCSQSPTKANIEKIGSREPHMQPI
jgi:hypothetical protein